MGMHSSSDAFNYIESFTNLERNFTSAQTEYKLERMAYMLEACGHPERSFRAVHIAGSKGKGSTAAITARILKELGYKTGLFTSPHLMTYKERITLAGEFFPDDIYIRNTELIKEMLECGKLTGNLGQPTTFELLTLLAFLIFKEQGCQWAVLETGMGGRLDATNLVVPEVSIITPIELEHCDVLGDTLEKIAFEKAGIIKKGCPVVLFQQSESVTAVVRRRCEEEGSALHIPDFSQIHSEFDSLYGQSFTYKGEAYALPLLGSHQLKNAAAVLEVVGVLRERGWKLEQTDVEHGLYAVSWPGRFELLSDEPLFVVDGGHNPQCAQTVAENLLHYFPDKRRILLLGILKDKDVGGLTDILDPVADEYICITPGSFRALPAEELAEHLKRYGKPVTVCGSIRDGVSAALDRSDEDSVVCAVGSLYSVGEIRYCFGKY